MLVVSVSVLKAKLSEYLDRVKGGEEVTVTERGRVVAHLVGRRGSAEPETQRLEDLVRQGLVRAGSGRISPGFWERPVPEAPEAVAIEALLADREESR